MKFHLQNYQNVNAPASFNVTKNEGGVSMFERLDFSVLIIKTHVCEESSCEGLGLTSTSCQRPASKPHTNI